MWYSDLDWVANTDKTNDKNLSVLRVPSSLTGRRMENLETI
eukprot:gene170-11599_t